MGVEQKMEKTGEEKRRGRELACGVRCVSTPTERECVFDKGTKREREKERKHVCVCVCMCVCVCACVCVCVCCGAGSVRSKRRLKTE